MLQRRANQRLELGHLYERYTKIWSYAVAGPA
jgi:hypothetical protein